MKNLIPDLWILGISYRDTTTEQRSVFAIGEDKYQLLLERAAEHQLREVFVLSTCNRTEIYAVAQSPLQILALLANVTGQNVNAIRDCAYIKQGDAAVSHLYRVTAGLESQILGDYEIVSQVRKAAKQAKAAGFVGPYLERLVNGALQASKSVKQQTQLSSGTVSVSFAAVQFLNSVQEKRQALKIVLIGTGKIGRSTCKNLLEYSDANDIVLVNRTIETAEQLAAELGVRSAPMSDMISELADADVVLVATNAVEPILFPMHFASAKTSLVLDLSIPNNVDRSVRGLPGVRVVDVDELSQIKDQTLALRMCEVPKAEAILQEHQEEFREWKRMRKYAPILTNMKVNLRTLSSSVLEGTNPDAVVQKTIDGLAYKMRRNSASGCHCIEALVSVLN